METIKLYDGLECVNEFSQAIHGKEYRKMAEETAEQYGYSFKPVEKTGKVPDAPSMETVVTTEVEPTSQPKIKKNK